MAQFGIFNYHLQGVYSIRDSYTESHLIDGYAVCMKDYEAGELITDPARFLIRMGIEVESYQRSPHRLAVSSETLHAAGVKLQDFILV
jgi:hypothetical protein